MTTLGRKVAMFIVHYTKLNCEGVMSAFFSTQEGQRKPIRERTIYATLIFQRWKVHFPSLESLFSTVGKFYLVLAYLPETLRVFGRIL